MPYLLYCSRSEEHTSELQSRLHLVCRLLLEKKYARTAPPSRSPWGRVSSPHRPARADAPGLRPTAPSHRRRSSRVRVRLFFFNDTATTEIYTLSLHDALPICLDEFLPCSRNKHNSSTPTAKKDRKSTRLNSSHGYISYAVFCLKKRETQN